MSLTSDKPKKNVLLTGCSTGIGHTLALELHQRGYHVWATARNLQSLQDLSGQGIQTLMLDVTNGDQIREVVDHIYKTDGHLDILVNNAGYGSMGPLIEMPAAELEKQFTTNVFAPMALIHAVAYRMCKRREGVIVNIGSVSGVLCTPFSGSYCASKAAINILSDVLRMELKPFGVRVVTVQPGSVKSQFGATASKVLSTVMKPESIYMPIEKQVQARAMASQDNPTSADKFCHDLVNKLESGRSLNVVRLAYGSFALPLLKALLPTRLLEKILGKTFGLDRLA